MLYVYGCAQNCGFAAVFTMSQGASIEDHVCLISGSEDQESTTFLGTITITPPQ